MARRTPLIIDAGGAEIAADSFDLPIPTGLSSAELAYGSFLVPGTGGFEAAVTGDLAITHMLMNLYDAAGSPQQNQVYATAAQLAASNHVAQGWALTGKRILIGEDGAGGNIADATVTPYVDVAVGAASVISANNNPTGGAQATVQIDSSSASASPTGLPFKIVQANPSSDAALIPAAQPKDYVMIPNPDL